MTKSHTVNSQKFKTTSFSRFLNFLNLLYSVYTKTIWENVLFIVNVNALTDIN